jgi:quinol monooxygenase YgiN
MTIRYGLLATIQAKPDKGPELADVLESARALAEDEAGTITWYAFRIDDTTYGIFDTFEDEQARDAHLGGEIPKALTRVGPDLLAADPDIQPVDVIAAK